MDSKDLTVLDFSGLELVNGELSMDSREIAYRTGKEHSNVCRDIRVMFESIGKDPLNFESIFFDSYKRKQKCYKLPKHELMLLLTGYSVLLRDKVLQRWEELENIATPKIPKTFAEALQLAADQAKEIEAKTAQLAITTPKAIVYDKISNADGLKTVQEVASILGYGDKMFFALLRGLDIFRYENNGDSKVNVPSSEYREKYFICRSEPYSRNGKDMTYTRIYVTPQGELWLADKIGKRANLAEIPETA